MERRWGQAERPELVPTGLGPGPRAFGPTAVRRGRRGGGAIGQRDGCSALKTMAWNAEVSGAAGVGRRETWLSVVARVGTHPSRIGASAGRSGPRVGCDHLDRPGVVPLPHPEGRLPLARTDIFLRIPVGRE
ncbi:hypothetical protein NDU88_004451 [Pleurodeles waltl]|uniref:Uncharacterized protein n=1 Tax=Pleurodeles waltl TaxID=8319 RepID=A0AAV7WV49_PLEWA|nr:hypothetical protein NDU88_004451 [Pleurodeles waltl]